MERMEQGSAGEPGRPRDILVMEDETSLAKGLQMILERDGHRVNVASSGHGAMDALRRKGFDLLVADLRLPDMDGMEVLREVKEKRPETKMIVITGYPSVSSAVDAMRLGVVDYLPKPFWDDDFRTAVENALKGGKNLCLKQEPDITVAPGERSAGRLSVGAAATPGLQPRQKVLLMEDEPSLAQGLKMVLSKEGHEVDLADTGLKAIGSLGNKEYDLLVADLRLPDMDGMEVIRTAREVHPDTEVIVITGYGSVPSAVESMKLGALDYLPKPFTEDEFKAAVENALKARQAILKAERIFPPVTEEERLIQRREVSRVLDRTAQDLGFWNELMEIGSGGLQGYRLSNEAKAAIVSGDLEWIHENVGELTQKQLKFIYKRLEREAW
ncbi:MAG: response regulator [Thermodesulfobacteriota bacterium]